MNVNSIKVLDGYGELSSVLPPCISRPYLIECYLSKYEATAIQGSLATEEIAVEVVHRAVKPEVAVAVTEKDVRLNAWLGVEPNLATHTNDDILDMSRYSTIWGRSPLNN